MIYNGYYNQCDKLVLMQTTTAATTIIILMQQQKMVDVKIRPAIARVIRVLKNASATANSSAVII